MVLEDLITQLEIRDPDKRVMNGFGSPHSDRGYYEDLAFEPVTETTFGEMLEHAKSAMGKTFEGYKGGEYKMHEYTDCKIGEWGISGEEITRFNFLYWDNQ
jgi:hypothetical protein